MNNPKLTNILLVALIVLNGLFLLTWNIHSMRNRHHHHFAQRDFHGRFSCRFMAFHRGFGAHRGDFGGFHGGFRNHTMLYGNCNCDMDGGKERMN